MNSLRRAAWGRSFERFDEGGKGWLCRAELKCAISSLVGYRPPRVEVQMMLEQTEDGQVTFEHFRPAMEVRRRVVRGGSWRAPPIQLDCFACRFLLPRMHGGRVNGLGLSLLSLSGESGWCGRSHTRVQAKLGAVDPEDHIRRLFKAFDVRCECSIPNNNPEPRRLRTHPLDSAD